MLGSQYTRNILCDFIISAYITEDIFVSYAIGNWHTHPSHHIVMSGGYLLCVKCGSTALKMTNLKYTCTGSPATLDATGHSHGSTNIKRYNKGKAPLGNPVWPYNHF